MKRAITIISRVGLALAFIAPVAGQLFNITWG